MAKFELDPIVSLSRAQGTVFVPRSAIRAVETSGNMVLVTLCVGTKTEVIAVSCTAAYVVSLMRREYDAEPRAALFQKILATSQALRDMEEAKVEFVYDCLWDLNPQLFSNPLVAGGLLLAAIKDPSVVTLDYVLQILAAREVR